MNYLVNVNGLLNVSLRCFDVIKSILLQPGQREQHLTSLSLALTQALG